MGRYPANYLIGRKPVFQRPKAFSLPHEGRIECGITPPFGGLFPTGRLVTYVLLSRLPLTDAPLPEGIGTGPFDLHA